MTVVNMVFSKIYVIAWDLVILTWTYNKLLIAALNLNISLLMFFIFI